MPPRGVKRARLEGHDGGGHRQREAAEDHALYSRHSDLATYLLQQNQLGHISMVMLCTICIMVSSGDPRHPDVLALAQLGNMTPGGNVCRDFANRIIRFPLQFAVSSVQAPIKLSGLIKNVNLDLIYPHVVFSKLYHCYPVEFARRMYNHATSSVPAFWESQKNHPSFAGHPMHAHEEGLQFRVRGLPIVLHGDDVASVGLGKIWAKAVDVVSWGSLLGSRGTSLETHLLIWLVFNNILATGATGYNTMQILWRHLVWSLHALYTGKWPHRDPDGNWYTSGPAFERAGTYLADGWFGVLWAHRFDLPWGQGQFHLADSSVGRVCMYCRATIHGACVWTDCSSDSCPWTHTIWTNDSYRAMLGDLRHRLLRVLAGFGAGNLIPDILHCKWLGNDQYLLGSALALLTHHWLAGSPQDNLVLVNKKIQETYGAVNVRRKDRYPHIRITQYKTGLVSHLPKLKGTGQQCKGLAAVMPQVFESFMAPRGHVANPLHRRVLAALQATHETNVLYESNRHVNIMPKADSDKIIELSFNIAKITTSLVKAYQPDIPLFHYTIKSHLTLHCALATKYTNVLFSDCGSGEDFMKVARKLIRGSMHGNAIQTVGNKSLQRYARAMHLAWDSESPWWK